MSKRSKKATAEKRISEKRARKAANKARYIKLREQGVNSKSSRFAKNAKKNKKAKFIDHPNGFCGNIACKKCFPQYNFIHIKFTCKY